MRHRGSPLRVVAGPGTGKTSCLVARVTSLITDDHVAPQKILAVTFTRAAAGGMRHRLEKQGIPPDNMPDVRTLHSKAVGLLRRHGSRLGLHEAVRPLSEIEAKIVIQDVVVDLESQGMKLPFKGIGAVPSHLRAYRSEQSGAGLPQWILGSTQNMTTFRAFAEAYEKLQEFYNSLDWFRAVNLTLRLLESQPDIMTEEQASLEHLLVDEYQDLNKSEQKLIRLLLNDPKGICVVGDEDQSIYETQRYADPRGIINFDSIIPGTTTLPLTICHRCPEKILDKANALISHNKERLPGKPKLRSADPKRNGVVATVRHRSKKAEIEWLVRKVLELHSKGYEYRDILILFAEGKIAEDYITALHKADVPLEVQLKVTGPFDSSCFGRVLSLLRVLEDQTDNLAVRQCLGDWPNIGPKTIKELRLISLQSGISLWEATVAVATNSTGHPSVARRRSVEEFHSAMSKLLSIQALDKIIPAVLENMPECSQDSGVQILKSYFERYSGQEGIIGVSEVLNNFEQEREAGAFDAKEELPDKVRVMTMHSAKGLEAKIVFIPALEDDIMPGEVPNIEERRRLLYVSVTRAREVLVLSWASQRTGQEIHRKGGRMLGKKPSRFLIEMGDVLN